MTKPQGRRRRDAFGREVSAYEMGGRRVRPCWAVYLEGTGRPEGTGKTGRTETHWQVCNIPRALDRPGSVPPLARAWHDCAQSHLRRVLAGEESAIHWNALARLRTVPCLEGTWSHCLTGWHILWAHSVVDTFWAHTLYGLTYSVGPAA